MSCTSHGNHPPSTGFVKCLTRLQANETAPRSGHDSHFLENSTLQATNLVSAQLPSVYPEQRVSAWYAKDTQEKSEAIVKPSTDLLLNVNSGVLNVRQRPTLKPGLYSGAR